MEYAIETSGLSKTYQGYIKALHSINLKVNRGVCFGLLGPNGAGKSTLVKTLLSIVHPSGGSATLLGLDSRSPLARKRVGYLPEGHRFPNYLTGRGVCKYFGRLAGYSGKALDLDIEKKLALVNMSEWADTKIVKYSKGMMQRVGLAQAMIGDPEILFLDEPTDGVDPVGRHELRSVIASIKAQGCTIFLNSHLLSEVEEICDEIAIMHKGKLVQQGTIDEIKTSAEGGGKGCVVKFRTSPINRDQIETLSFLDSQEEKLDAFQLALESETDITTIIDQLRAENIEIFSVQPQRIDLEDAFMELVKGPGETSNQNMGAQL